MAVRTDLTDALLALLPEDGSRLSKEALQAALEEEVEDPYTEEDLEDAKAHLVAMGAAERVKGPGGGLRVAGLNGSAKAQSPSPGRRKSSSKAASAAASQSSIAPGTTAASVLTGELRNQVDRIWDAFWSGGISNPLEVLEQLTYLLFIRRLDELEILEERFTQRSGQPMRRRIFPEGADEQGRPWAELRWSHFRELGNPSAMFQVVSERVFPFLRRDAERERERTAQSFCVPNAKIAEQDYDLSLNRYKELIHEEVEHRPPLEILAELRAIEQEILQGIDELEGMLR